MTKAVSNPLLSFVFSAEDYASVRFRCCTLQVVSGMTLVPECYRALTNAWSRLTKEVSMSKRTSLAAIALVVVALFLAVGLTKPVLGAAPNKTPRFVDNGDGTVTDNQTGTDVGEEDE